MVPENGKLRVTDRPRCLESSLKCFSISIRSSPPTNLLRSSLVCFVVFYFTFWKQNGLRIYKRQRWHGLAVLPPRLRRIWSSALGKSARMMPKVSETKNGSRHLIFQIFPSYASQQMLASNTLYFSCSIAKLKNVFVFFSVFGKAFSTMFIQNVTCPHWKIRKYGLSVCKQVVAYFQAKIEQCTIKRINLKSFKGQWCLVFIGEELQATYFDRSCILLKGLPAHALRWWCFNAFLKSCKGFWFKFFIHCVGESQRLPVEFLSFFRDALFNLLLKYFHCDTTVSRDFWPWDVHKFSFRKRTILTLRRNFYS